MLHTNRVLKWWGEKLETAAGEKGWHIFLRTAWRTVSGRTARQTNNWDCGIIMILTFASISSGTPDIEFGSRDIPRLRRWLRDFVLQLRPAPPPSPTHAHLQPNTTAPATTRDTPVTFTQSSTNPSQTTPHSPHTNTHPDIIPETPTPQPRTTTSATPPRTRSQQHHPEPPPPPPNTATTPSPLRARTLSLSDAHNHTSPHDTSPAPITLSQQTEESSHNHTPRQDVSPPPHMSSQPVEENEGAAPRLNPPRESEEIEKRKSPERSESPTNWELEMWRTLSEQTEETGVGALTTASVLKAVQLGDPRFKQILMLFTDWQTDRVVTQPLTFTRSIPFFARTIRLTIEEVESEQAGSPAQKAARSL
jgi:hypothetical protein